MPRALKGLISIFILFVLFFTPRIVSAKGLGTEELGNTEKDEISQLAKKITDNPEDGPLVFASAQGLIKHHHVEAFGQLKNHYEKCSDIAKAMIIKAIGQQREKVIDAAGEYWQILNLGLASASEAISKEVVTSLAFLESEVFFDKLLEVLKSKGSPKTAVDNVIKVLCRFEQGPSGIPVITEKTLALRIGAAKHLAVSDNRNRACLLESLGEELGENFTNTNELEKWWEQNKTKPILQIQIEAKRRIQAGRKAAEDRAESEQQAKIQEIIKRLDSLEESGKKDEFLKVLKDPKVEPEILSFVMGWLKHQKREDVQDAVVRLRQLMNHKDIRVRVGAIEAIGAVGDRENVHEVSSKLGTSNQEEKRAAIHTIASLGGKEASKVLLKALETEKDAYIRQEILKGLGTVGLPGAITRIVLIVAVVHESEAKIEKLRDGITPELMRVVANALGNILKSGNQCEESARGLAIRCMIAMLETDNNPVKFDAIKNLGDVGAQEATDILIKVLESKKDIPGVRKAAARALGKMPNPEEGVVNTLYGKLKDKAGEVAQASMWALRNIAGLNGSRRDLNLKLLEELGKKLSAEKAHELVLDLFKSLPDEKELKTTDKEAIGRLYNLKGVLAWAQMEAGNPKAAAVELEKVVVYFPKVLRHREMLARCYAAQKGQITKAIDEYERLIKMVKPSEAQAYWKESLKLIKLVGDSKEKSKRVDSALKLTPPQGVKEELEQLKQELSATVQKTPKNP